MGRTNNGFEYKPTPEVGGGKLVGFTYVPEKDGLGDSNSYSMENRVFNQSLARNNKI